MEFNNKNNKKEVKKILLEATSKALGTAKSELGSREAMTIPEGEGKVNKGGKLMKIGNHSVNLNNEKSDSQGWFAGIKNIKSRLVAAFSEEREGSWQDAANIKLMNREVYKLVDQLSGMMFDEYGEKIESQESRNIKLRIKEIIMTEAQNNLSLNTEYEAAGSEVGNIEEYVDDFLSMSYKNIDSINVYSNKFNQIGEALTDQRHLDTLQTAGTNTRGFMANAAILAGTKGLVLATGAAAVMPVALADAALKAGVETNTANANIDRRNKQEDGALNQEINYLLSPKESLAGQEGGKTIPLFALKAQFDAYQTMKAEITKGLVREGGPEQEAKLKILESNANALLGQSHQFVKFYYDLESKVITGAGKLSPSNYYSYQAIGEFVDNLLDQLQKDGLSGSLYEGEINRRLLCQDFVANAKTVQVETGQLSNIDGLDLGDQYKKLFITYKKQNQKFIDDEAYKINLVSNIASEERMFREVEAREAKTEAKKKSWSFKNLSKTAVLSAMSSTFGLLAKGLGAIAGSENLQGKHLVGVDFKTKVFSGAVEEQSKMYMQLQDYIQTEANSKLYDTLNPEWVRSITERIGVDKPIKGVTQWFAKNYAKFVVENQNSALNSLPDAVKQGFKNVSPVDAQFRKGMNMGANGGIRDEMLKQGGKIFSKVREFDFGSKVPYQEAIKRIAKSSTIFSGIGSVLSALPMLKNKKSRLSPVRIDTTKDYDIKAGQTGPLPKLDNRINDKKITLPPETDSSEQVPPITQLDNKITDKSTVLPQDSEGGIITTPDTELPLVRLTQERSQYLSLDQETRRALIRPKLSDVTEKYNIFELKNNDFEKSITRLAKLIKDSLDKDKSEDIIVIDVTKFKPEELALINSIIDTIPTNNNLRLVKYLPTPGVFNPTLQVKNIINENLKSGLPEGIEPKAQVNIIKDY
jgi:hypothetical protein